MVDIIMPVHNRVDLVGETVESVKAQRFPSWRLIAVDDFSSDGTATHLDLLASQDPRISVIRIEGKSRGACHARNQGFRAGNAPFVLFLDSDDLLAPGCLETRLARLQESPDFDFTLGLTALFEKVPGDLDLLWNCPSCDPDLDLLRFLRQDMPWHTMSPLWKREAVGRVGDWNENLAAFQDWEFHSRACLSRLKYGFSGNSPDSFYRQPSPENLSISCHYFSKEKTRARFEALRSLTSRPEFQSSGNRRNHAAAFIVRNALQLLEQGFRARALSFLGQGIQAGLVPVKEVPFLLALIVRGRFWRHSRLVKKCLHERWPEALRADPDLPADWSQLRIGDDIPELLNA